MTHISRRNILRGLTGAAAAGTLSWAGGSPASAINQPTAVKVLSLNAWYGGTAVSGGVDMIVEIIKKSGASVVFIAEAKATTTEITKKLNDSGLLFTQRMTGDNAILSTYSISEATALPFMTKAIVTVGSVQVAAYAAHLEYRWYATYLPRGYGAGVPSGEFSEYGWAKIPSGPVTDVAALKRVNQASGRPQVIEEFIADTRKELARGRIVIMGGDFNEPSALDWTAKTAGLFDHNGAVVPWQSTKALKDSGFVDSYRKQHPNPASHPGFTWPASNPHAPVSKLTWAPEADERDRIDYIFHFPDARLKLSDAQVVGPKGSIVRNERVDETGEDPFVLSDIDWPTDHKGVLTTYLLRSDRWN